MARVFNLKSYLIAWLRRGSYRVPYVKVVKDNARISRGLYSCASCNTAVRNGGYDIDHIVPVVDVNDGFIDFNTFIDRLFPGPLGLQLLCKQCHIEKTKHENKGRVNVRRKKVRSRKA